MEDKHLRLYSDYKAVGPRAESLTFLTDHHGFKNQYEIARERVCKSQQEVG